MPVFRKMDFIFFASTSFCDQFDYKGILHLKDSPDRGCIACRLHDLLIARLNKSLPVSP
jgi:hypothetical protein